MIPATASVEEALLLLKVAFIVLLYLFIWRIVASASRDLRVPQESFVLAPQQARQLTGTPPQPAGRLVVLQSPAAAPGTEHTLDSRALTVGRGGQNDVPLDADDFASARHARFEPRRDGVWVEDIGSTNGTYVNGARLSQPRLLRPGDVIRIGQTDLRFDR